MTPSVSHRCLALDLVKGFAVFLVIVGHVVQFCTFKSTYADNSLFNFIYSFHMPFFMLLSGYVFAYTGGKSNSKVSSIISRRACQLLIPFFFWAVFKGLVVKGESLSFLMSVIIRPCRGLWFLWVLFFVVFAERISYVLSKSTKIPYLCSCFGMYVLLYFVCFYVTSAFALYQVFFHFLFYCTGIILYNFRFIDRINHSSIYTWTVSVFTLVLVFILLASHYHHDPTHYGYIDNFPSQMRSICTLIMSTSISIVLLLISFRVEQLFKYTYLHYFGKASLGIYAIHFLLLDCIPDDWGGGISIHFLLQYYC